MFQKIKKLKMLKNKGIAHIRLEIRVTVEVVLIILSSLLQETLGNNIY